jgi:hypothetical protein
MYSTGQQHSSAESSSPASGRRAVQLNAATQVGSQIGGLAGDCHTTLDRIPRRGHFTLQVESYGASSQGTQREAGARAAFRGSAGCVVTPKGVSWQLVRPPTDREKVLIGRDGWLFLQRDTNDVVGQHTGRVRLGRRGREAWRALLSERISRAKRFGVVWVSLIAPDKESVYPEYLPPEIVPSPRRPVHELLEVARSVEAPVLYPVEELVAAKDQGPLYFPTDTHWTHRGAYVAYRALCRELAGRGVELGVVEERAINWIRDVRAGGLGSKLEPELKGVGLVARLDHQASRLAFDNGVTNHGRVMIFEQDRTTLPSCIVFGESFTMAPLLFLRESFRRLVFVHTSMMIPDVIEWETPDVVINLPTERFLVRVPSDRDALSMLTHTVRQKVGSDGVPRVGPDGPWWLRLDPTAFDERVQGLNSARHGAKPTHAPTGSAR